MKIIHAILLIALSATAAGASAGWNPADSLPTLRVESAVAGVRVTEAGRTLGVTPFDPVVIPEGIHHLLYIHPDSANWLYPPVADTVLVPPHRAVIRTALFAPVVRVESQPFGADVLFGDSLAGSTPCYLKVRGGRGWVTLRKAGYRDETIPVPSGGGRIALVLNPAEGGAAPGLVPDRSEPSVPVLITAGAAVVTGVAAAYCKIKADNRYDDYRLSGDEAALSSVRRYDLAAGLSLAACEINLILLTTYLFSR